MSKNWISSPLDQPWAVDVCTVVFEPRVREEMATVELSTWASFRITRM
jgi:hypothetical protein